MLFVRTGLVSTPQNNGARNRRITNNKCIDVETDLISSVNTTNTKEDFFAKSVRLAPKVPIQTVVDGFLTLVTDQSRNCKLIGENGCSFAVLILEINRSNFNGRP